MRNASARVHKRCEGNLDQEGDSRDGEKVGSSDTEKLKLAGLGDECDLTV